MIHKTESERRDKIKKRILRTGLACLLIFSLTACGGGNGAAVGSSGNGATAGSSGNSVSSESNETGAGTKSNGNSTTTDSAWKSSNVENSESSAGSDSSEESGGKSNAAGKDTMASRDIFAMDTYMTITVYAAQAEEAVQAAIDEIQRLDALLSTGSETSEVAQINQNGSGLLGEDGIRLMRNALALYESTGGLFDISIYPVMELWGFPTQQYHVPTGEELRETLDLVNASAILFEADTGEISFPEKGMKIDFGGIAKGYTSQRLVDIFRTMDVTCALVNLGGNVEAYGRKTDGSLWKIGIQHPDKDGTYVGVVEIENCAVITSGGYERYFEENGTTYHHILDPRTGFPARSGLSSVTIVAADGTLADGLSTALYIMGLEDATAYWQEHADEFEAVLLTEDGVVHVTEGLKGYFSSGLPVEYISR